MLFLMSNIPALQVKQAQAETLRNYSNVLKSLITGMLLNWLFIWVSLAQKSAQHLSGSKNQTMMGTHQGALVGGCFHWDKGTGWEEPP